MILWQPVTNSGNERDEETSAADRRTRILSMPHGRAGESRNKPVGANLGAAADD